MVTHLHVNKKLIRGLIGGLIGIALTLTPWLFGWLDPWEAKTWDWRVRFLAKPGSAMDAIRVILLDQDSLDWAVKTAGVSWPWPREFYGAIANYCQKAGAKVLAFDVIFSEFSGSGVEDDAVFGRALAQFPNFAGAIFLGDGKDTTWPKEFPPPRFKIHQLEHWLQTTHATDIVFLQASMPIPEIVRNAAVLCKINEKPDPDGMYRQVKLFGLFDNQVFPVMGLGAYLATDRDAQLTLKPGQLIVGAKIIPIDQQGNVVLRYHGSYRRYKYYNASEVVGPGYRLANGEELTARDREILSDLKDKYVFFGFSAPGLKDLRATPLDEVSPGVLIHATVLDNLLSGDFIQKIPAWVTIGFVLGFALSCAILASFFSNPAANVVMGGIFLPIPALLSLGAYVIGFWLPLFVQEMAVAVTIVTALVINYATEGRQKRFIKDAFKHYLSSAVIEQIIQHPEQLKLGGERRVLSIFFSDLQGFTSISEKLDPEALTALLNDYLSVMTDIIYEEDGTVDKYEGDAIIAFWNAPLNVPDHAIRVVRAALRCQAKLAEMRPAFKERMGKEMFMRIGINTGPAVVGNMGSHTRFNYTILGDAVNLAARLEGVNKQFGTYTMISQATHELLGGTFAAREVARVAVVGRKEPVVVYEPMFPEEYEQKKQRLETFAQSLALFYNGKFAQAIEVFATLREVDPVAAAYIEKCREYLSSPPENWQGVWVMTSK